MRARVRDFQPDAEELAAARRAAKAPIEGAALGGGIGTALGAGVGALGLLGGPALAAATIPGGASIGGALGNALGSGIGDASASDAEKLLRAREEARAKKMAALQEREAAYAELMKRG